MAAHRRNSSDQLLFEAPDAEDTIEEPETSSSSTHARPGPSSRLRSSERASSSRPRTDERTDASAYELDFDESDDVEDMGVGACLARSTSRSGQIERKSNEYSQAYHSSTNSLSNGHGRRRSSSNSHTSVPLDGSFRRTQSGGNGYGYTTANNDDQDYGNGHGNGMGKDFSTTTSSKLESGGDQVLAMRRKQWILSTAITALFVLAWYFFATLLSLYNKWMFSPEYYGFSYPLFVTSIHMLVQWFLAWVVLTIAPKKFRPQEKPKAHDYGQKIVPTAVTTALDIGLSNLSLKTITLSLYTMCKSSTLIFVLGFAFYFRLEKWSLRLILVIVTISIGVFLMVFNATTVSIPGIIMVFTASSLAGLRWALTQLIMHNPKMGMTNPFATIFWLAPVMCVTLALISMAVEGWITIFASASFQGVKALTTMVTIIFPGTLAFSMVASEYFIIQRAGIVPLSVAGIFKEVSTISVSAWVFGDELTRLNELGVFITIIGIATYSYHKYQKSIHEPDDERPVPTGAADYQPLQLPLETVQTNPDGRPMHVIGGDEDDEEGMLKRSQSRDLGREEEGSGLLNSRNR